MKQLTIIGVGVGPDSVTQSARRAIESAQVLFGAPRLLTEWASPQKAAHPCYTAAQIAPIIDSSIAVSGIAGRRRPHGAGHFLPPLLFRPPGPTLAGRCHGKLPRTQG